MRRSVLRTALVIAVLAAVTGATPATATAMQPPTGPVPDPAAGVGVRLVDVPVSARDDPRAQLYIVDHVAPGTVIERRIEVSNTSAVPLRVAVYSAAASIAGGSFAGADGHTPNDLSLWTTPAEAVLEIAPGARTLDLVTVAVPADAAPGEQYAVVWAEISTPGTGGVTLVNRVGIRLYLSVGPGNAPAAAFTVDSLTAVRTPDGAPLVLARVHNTGGRALDLSGALSLTAAPGSLRAGPFPARSGGTLAPGQSGEVSVEVDRQLPAGPWDAALSISSGPLQQEFRARVEFPPAPGAADPVAARQATADPPWLLIGLITLLTILTAAVVATTVRHRRSRR